MGPYLPPTASPLLRGLAALVLAAAGSACDAEETDGIGNDTSDETESRYAFSDDDPFELAIIDQMGTPLTSTSLANRSDRYQSVAPSSIGYLPTFLKNLGRMHAAFASNLEEHGLEPCSLNTLVKDFVTPCTLQSVWEGGPRVSDVVVPDSIELHLDQPARWPNGRPILVCSVDRAWRSDEECAALGGEIRYLQINDLVLAMGFLDLGAECPGAPGGTCSLETFVEMELNAGGNDAELPNTFPYLAPPH